MEGGGDGDKGQAAPRNSAEKDAIRRRIAVNSLPDDDPTAPFTLNGRDSGVSLGVGEATSARIGRSQELNKRNDSIGLGVGEAIGARVESTDALDRRVGGVGLGAGEMISARVEHTRALDGGGGSIGLGVNKAFRARIERDAEVADARGRCRCPHRRCCRRRRRRRWRRRQRWRRRSGGASHLLSHSKS